MDWYCLCREFSGCPLPNGTRDCFVCQIEKHYNFNDIEYNYDINYIIKTYINLTKDLDKYTNFDPTSDYFWLDDYVDKIREYDGRVIICYLRDYISKYLRIEKIN